ncbi:uncharacterized protein LACBIDRAFT_298151 [Laccaria bicolor S238N-H82]|uniref:Predicted protein n=1 Tax=Laccaria bicolor (strain S238N-H82 / ATCC MYA-4686) TaxID=486041 RepID=B0DCC7_LACBS|nr:uncharacterized protein LACBIDRAFT_298151 [Laccaria bicolor S238N-H82]EDR07878.1 predicted protein [Laccaria bicolor S238N-H82]|eukprot:XP_001881667.1 predicted protein [Laccaria bicolor S238N-H82]
MMLAPASTYTNPFPFEQTETSRFCMTMDSATATLAFFAKLPLELRWKIMTFAFLLQMQAEFGTNDYDEMAKRVCNYGMSGAHFWLAALLDIGMHIPNPPIQGKGVGFFRTHELYDGWSPFHVAAQAGNIPLIQRLVRLGYDINTVETTGETAVRAIAEEMGYHDTRVHQDLLVLQALFKEGADINFVHKEGKCAHIIYELIRHDWTKPQLYNTCVAAIKLLVKHGAPLDRSLHAVADAWGRSNPKLIKVLLDAGAGIEELWNGMTPLVYAASQKDPKVVQALLDAGASLNVVGTGEGILFAAISPIKDHYVYAPTTAQTLTVLCNAGANTAQLNHDNHSVLSFALTESGYSTKRHRTWDTVPAVVEALCKGGADVNIHHHNVPYGPKKGDTPLHVAIDASTGNPRASSVVRSECVEILILHGADVNAKNDAGQTPLHLAAAARNNLACAQVLLQHGAKLDVKDSDGNTPLMLAQGEVVAFLAEQEHEAMGTREITE